MDVRAAGRGGDPPGVVAALGRGIRANSGSQRDAYGARMPRRAINSRIRPCTGMRLLRRKDPQEGFVKEGSSEFPGDRGSRNRRIVDTTRSRKDSREEQAGPSPFAERQVTRLRQTRATSDGDSDPLAAPNERDLRAELLCDARERVFCGIASAALDAADLGLVDPCPGREIVLRQVRLATQQAELRTEAVAMLEALQFGDRLGTLGGRLGLDLPPQVVERLPRHVPESVWGLTHNVNRGRFRFRYSVSRERDRRTSADQDHRRMRRWRKRWRV